MVLLINSFLCGGTYEECVSNMTDTKNSTTMTFLGNVIDSEKMIVFLPDEKKEKIVNECKCL